MIESPPRTVAIVGATGQIGSQLCRTAGHRRVIPLSHQELAIEDHDAVRQWVLQNRPDAVVNTAAFHRVDECEGDPMRAFAVNAVAVRQLALACRDAGAILVHISTDYVFGGDATRITPYREDDAPAPVNTYGVSKLAGELMVRAYLPRHFIVRTAAVYGRATARPGHESFVERMLRLANEGRTIRVVNDQVTGPTYAADLASAIWRVLDTGLFGTYHITNSGQCTWYRFARRIFELAGVSADLHPTTAAEFGAAAPRPSFSVLAHGALRRAGIGDMRPWDQALASYMAERSHITS